MYTPASLIWDTPSKDSSGSMPLGNGDIGLNVWVEENGDLLFYLSKTDAWDENARLLKLGRIRVALSPNPFITGATFRQELDLNNGCIRISSAINQQPLSVLLWVDANRPVVRVGIDSITAIDVRVTLEVWRTTKRLRETAEASFSAGSRNQDELETVFPDTVFDTNTDALLWCHRNTASCWQDTLEHQDMSGWIEQGSDPLKKRTFGALLRGEGLVRKNSSTLRTNTPGKAVRFSIHPLTTQSPTVEEWCREVSTIADKNDEVFLETAFAEHKAWWQTFWQRSWIRVWGTPEAEIVSRGYELQRFINACGGRGAFPIKFNGSIFTVDARETGETFDADYRRWGPGYWFQNTRLTYWQMIMSGDYDLMQPWFQMYLDALPLAKARAKICLGIDDAAFFPETMTFWGTFLNSNYGYDRIGIPPGLTQNTFIRRYWQGNIELIAVMLDVYAVNQDETLLQDYLLVLAPPFLRFYRDYFKERDGNGKMRIAPSQSLETWHEAVNPLPDVAGLQWVLDGLLALPENKLPSELRTEWQELRNILPPLPTRTYVWEKRIEILPALEYDRCANSENPELYAVFPYRLFGIGKPDLEIGRATWHARRIKDTGGWRQDPIQAALLGLTEEARRDVVKNFSTSHTGSRFPAFWGPNFDWVPDQDHGSNACIALQRMVMQCDNGKIRLLPAWPEDWSVDFRLHAPDKTLVEAEVANGIMRKFRVSPEARRHDILTDFQIAETSVHDT